MPTLLAAGAGYYDQPPSTHAYQRGLVRASDGSAPAGDNPTWLLVAPDTSKGHPSPDWWRLVQGATPVCQPGELLLELQLLSVDPYLRHRIHDAPRGQPTESFAVSRVVESNHCPGYAVGDLVHCAAPWQRFYLSDGRAGLARRLDPAAGPARLSLSLFGLTGFTAYFALVRDGQHRPGDVVVVSAAAGSVGSFVAQLAKARGSRVIGVARGAAKCAWLLSDLGLDGAIDHSRHTSASDITAQLRLLAPDGVDLYVDNTSGPVTDGVWPVLRKNGRVVVVGAIAEYNAERTPDSGVVPLADLIYRTVTVKGHLVLDHLDPDSVQALVADVGPLYGSGKVKVVEQVYHGFESVPAALMSLFEPSSKMGKVLIEL